ncbi:nitrogen permease regulator of amino acid transport activity 3-domain-containing protein [Dipodascopsis uninucleata]
MRGHRSDTEAFNSRVTCQLKSFPVTITVFVDYFRGWTSLVSSDGDYFGEEVVLYFSVYKVERLRYLMGGRARASSIASPSALAPGSTPSSSTANASGGAIGPTGTGGYGPLKLPIVGAPYLLGIILVITTSSGPQFVFNYPQDLSSGNSSSATGGTSNGANFGQNIPLSRRASAYRSAAASPLLDPLSSRDRSPRSFMLSSSDILSDDHSHSDSGISGNDNENGHDFNNCESDEHKSDNDSNDDGDNFLEEDDSVQDYTDDDDILDDYYDYNDEYDDYLHNNDLYGSENSEYASDMDGGSSSAYSSDNDVDELTLDHGHQHTHHNVSVQSPLIQHSGQTNRHRRRRRRRHGGDRGLGLGGQYSRSRSSHHSLSFSQMLDASASVPPALKPMARDRYRSRTPVGRRTNLSNSITLDQDNKDGEEHERNNNEESKKDLEDTPTTLESSNLNTRVSTSYSDRNIDSVIGESKLSPRLAALSTIDTSVIANSIDFDDFSSVLRSSSRTVSSSGVQSTMISPNRDTPPPSSRGANESSFNPPARTISRQSSGRKNESHQDKSNQRQSVSGKRQSEISSDPDTSDNQDSLDRSESKEYSRPWEQSLGYDAGFLASLLCPRRSMCDNRFELTIGELAFVGLPVHVREDGKWLRPGRKNAKSWRFRRAGNSGYGGSVSAASATVKSMTSESDRFESVFGYDGEEDDQWNEDSATGTGTGTGGSSMAFDEDDAIASNVNSDDEGKPKKPDFGDMTMFHVVFVMKPPELESNNRMDDIYNYIGAPLAECFRFEQRMSGYVWKQAEIMLREQEKAAVRGESQGELWSRLVTRSSMALALAQMYLSLSQNAIANVEINGILRSFQIPLTMQSASLPSIYEPHVHEGFYLTSEVVGSSEGLPVLEHALLLLDSPENIIRVTQTDERSKLAKFIRYVSASETLSRVARNLGMEAHDVEQSARHLMYWRRARLISPLSRRGIYIVAPTAPIMNVSRHGRKFSREFPTLPKLEKFLEKLSRQTPRSFSNVMPASTTDRGLYLDALAWLMRYGYLAQLRTFVWLRIRCDIKTAVKESMGEASDAENRATDKESGHGYEDTILLDPTRATVLERKWMDAVIAGHNEENTKTFWKTVKYMNGKNALEDVLVREREFIGRRHIRHLLSAIHEHVIIVRHW